MESLAFKTPRKRRTIKELDAFIDEWRAKEKYIDEVLGGDAIEQFNPMPGRVHLDPIDDRNSYDRLQSKTQAFLDLNFRHHGFITGRYGDGCDRTDLRLNIRVRHRIKDLEDIRARADYAEVPDGCIKKLSKGLGKAAPDFLANVIARIVQAFSGSASS